MEHYLEERSIWTKEEADAREAVHKRFIVAGQRLEELEADPMAMADIAPHLLSRG